MITVIFAALTLEAFINNYGIEVSSRNRFDKYLDKLDFVSKWLILPKLNTGKELNTDHQAFQNLQNLCALRNKLVHPKTFKRRISEIKDNDWTTEKDAHNAIMTVEILIKELKKLDNKIDIAWLEQIKVLCR
jgi:hypothetical protein